MGKEDFEEFLQKWKKENLTKKYDGFNNLLFKRINFLKSNNKFVEWIKNKEIKGNGISGDPYIIDSSIELPERLFLSNLDLFVLIESRELNLLDLKKCKKITVKDCKFTKLTFLRCRDLTIINSDINALNVLRSKDLKFENCKISLLFHSNSKNIKYFKSEIKSDYFKEASKFRNEISSYNTNLNISPKNPYQEFLRINSRSGR